MIHQIHEEEMNDTEQLRKRVAQNISKGPFELTPRTASQQEYSPDNIKKFSSKEHMMAYKLSDMAARAKDDEVAVFLSRMSDKISGEDKERMTVDDVEVLKNVLKNIKDLDRAPKPAEEPKQIKGGGSIYEVDQLTESFERILGIFTDAPVVAQSNTVSEDMTAGEMMQKYSPDQRKKINAKADEMMKKDGKDTSDHKLWTSYLNAAARMLGMQKADENVQEEEHVEEDNAFNTAAAQAAVKGEKNFTFNGKSYPVKMDKEAAQKLLDENPMTQADLDSERFAELHDFEEYKDAVMSDIKDPKSMYAGKSKQEIIAMLRKEADGIGYADVSDGDRRPEEPTWLNKIADEMEDEKTSDTTEELDRIKHLAGLTSN